MFRRQTHNNLRLLGIICRVYQSSTIPLLLAMVRCHWSIVSHCLRDSEWALGEIVVALELNIIYLSTLRRYHSQRATPVSILVIIIPFRVIVVRRLPRRHACYHILTFISTLWRWSVLPTKLTLTKCHALRTRVLNPILVNWSSVKSDWLIYIYLFLALVVIRSHSASHLVSMVCLIISFSCLYSARCELLRTNHWFSSGSYL